MKYLQFNVTESSIAASIHTFYSARLWWLMDGGTIAEREKRFGSEEDAWLWIGAEIKDLENQYSNISTQIINKKLDKPAKIG